MAGTRHEIQNVALNVLTIRQMLKGNTFSGCLDLIMTLKMLLKEWKYT